VTTVARSFAAAAERLPRPFWLCRQMDSVDCGPACLAMVARHYGRRISLERLRRLCAVDRQGTSLLQLSRAAERIGFRTMRVRTTYPCLVTDAPLPLIVHWSQDHFVVVYGRTRDGVRVADPGRGLVTYSEAEFTERWANLRQRGTPAGIALLLEPAAQCVANEDEEELQRPALRGLGLLRQYVLRHGRTLGQVAVGAAAVAALRLALPFLTQSLVDLGVQRHDLGVIQLILIAQIVLIASRASLEFLQGWLLLHMGSRIDMSVVSDFLRKLLSLPLGFFEARLPGDLLQRVEDHSRIEQLLSTTLLVALGALLSLAVFACALLVYSSEAFIVLAIGGTLQLLYAGAFLRSRTVLDNSRFAQIARCRSLLMECVAGVAEIKLNGAEVEKRWD
jgi:ATP-binding cassette, subfamily B, bacterial